MPISTGKVTSGPPMPAVAGVDSGLEVLFLAVLVPAVDRALEIVDAVFRAQPQVEAGIDILGLLRGDDIAARRLGERLAEERAQLHRQLAAVVLRVVEARHQAGDQPD